MPVSALSVDLALLALVAVGAVTDVREGRVYNALTYPGAAMGIVLNGIAEPAGLGWQAGLLGLLVGFGALFLAYMAGGLGGGDVKLMGMVGAFLGPLATLYALLYTFIVGAVLALALIVWKEGLFGLGERILRRSHDASGEDGEGAASPVDPIRLPFALAVLLGVAWLVAERAVGMSLLEMVSGRL